MNIEIPFEKDITIDRFWEIAKDLFFTKTYYNENTNEYYTEKAPKKCSADDMNLLLVSFITLSSSYCDILSKNYKHRDQFYHEISEFIVGLDCYRDNLEFCIRKMLSLLNFISDSNSNLLLSLTQNYEQIEKNESLLKDIVESIDKNEKLIKIIGWLLIVTYKAGLFGNKHINYEDHLGADKEDEVNDTTATLQDGNGSSVNNVGTDTDIDIEEEIENLHSNSAGYSFLLACKDSADSPPPSSAITSNSANTGVSTLKETTDSYSARIQEMAKLKQGNTSNESTDTRDSKLVFNLKILDMLRRFSGFRTFAKIFKDYLKLSDAYTRFPKFNKIIKENLQSRENNNKDTTNDENNNIDNNDDSDPYGPRSLNFYEYLSASYINYTEDPFISSYINYLELFYETCKNFEFSSNDLILIDSNFLNMIYRNLKVRTKDEDSLNYLKFKVLLILNEQYMVAYYLSLSNKNSKNDSNSNSNSNQDSNGRPIENKVFNTMIIKDNFNIFAETLILNFNRETDHILKILMLKVLYLIFTTSKTCQWVYLNDLKVLIDIFIRELFNLSARRDESLINTYLRVLCPMLIFTNLKDEDYKLDSIKEVLNYLNNFENSSKTTKKLSLKCLKLDLFNKLENEIKNSKLKNGLKNANNNNNTNSNDESKSPAPVQTPNNSTTNSLTNSLSRNGSTSTVNTVNSISSNNSRLPPPPPPPRSNSSANFNSSKNNSNNNSEQSSVKSSRSASISSASAVTPLNSNSTATSTATANTTTTNTTNTRAPAPPIPTGISVTTASTPSGTTTPSGSGVSPIPEHLNVRSSSFSSLNSRSSASSLAYLQTPVGFPAQSISSSNNSRQDPILETQEHHYQQQQQQQPLVTSSQYSSMPNSGIGRVKTNKPPPPPPPPLSSLAPPTPPPRPSPSALTGKNQGTQNRSANGTLDSLVPPQSSGYSRAQSHRSQSFDSYYSESSNYPPSPLQYQSKLQPQSPVHSHSLPQLQQHKVPPNYQNSPGHNNNNNSNNNNNNNNVLNKNNSGSSDDQTSLISYTSVNSEITVSTSNSPNGIQSNGNGISCNNSNSIKNSHNSYFANNTQSSGHNTACNNNTVGSGDAGWGARRRLTPHLESPDGSSVSNSNQYPPPPRPPPMQPRKHIHLNDHSDSSLISGLRRL